jgi:hypothetical protein
VIHKKMSLIKQVIGERLKGVKGEDVIYEAGSEVKDLFDAMLVDARNDMRGVGGVAKQFVERSRNECSRS